MKRIRINSYDARLLFEDGIKVYRTAMKRSPYLQRNAVAGMSTWDEAVRVYGGETRRSWFIDVEHRGP